MASKATVALTSKTASTSISATFSDGLARFGAILAVLACIVACMDRWCPIPVAVEELGSVTLLLLLPLAWNSWAYLHDRSSSSDDCQKNAAAGKIAEEQDSDFEEQASAEIQAESQDDQGEPSVQIIPQRIATASLDGTVMLWGAGSGNCEHKLACPSGALTAVAYSADATLLVTGACDGTARVWDAQTGACKHVLDDGGGGVCSVALSTCGSLVLTGLDDYSAQLWRIAEDATPESPELVLQGHESTVASVALSPCGAFAATGSWDGTARIWSVASGECVHILQGHEAEVFSVAFSPSGGLLATASQDATARVWSVCGGYCMLTLDSHESSVRSVAFSPCGRQLATGCWDGSARLWNIDNGTCQSLMQHFSRDSPIHSIAFSSDGSTLASVAGNSVRLLSTDTGACVKTLNGHTDSVQSVAMSSLISV